MSTSNNVNVTIKAKKLHPKRPATKITTSPSPQQLMKKAIYIFPSSSSSSISSTSSAAAAKPFFSTTIATKPLNFLPERKIVPKEMYATSIATMMTTKPAATSTPATYRPKPFHQAFQIPTSTITKATNPSATIKSYLTPPVTPTKPPKKKTKFDDARDIALFKETLSCHLFDTQKQTQERKAKWLAVSSKMSELFPGDETYEIRTVKDRLSKSMETFKKKNNAELKGSGIEVDYSEKDNLLQDLLDLEKTSLDIKEQRDEETKKKKESQQQGLEMRKRALESMSETQERLQKPKKVRKQRSDKKKIDSKGIVDCIKQKWSSDKTDKEKELALREREIALRETESGNWKLLIATMQETIDTQKARIAQQEAYIERLLKEKES
ncbi:synaptonemal complex protein 1-like [Clytia hemisphaerica]|uniref:synaptonemal complex protein 1-like n=1 Tax=Clytia hemisphaerica TaxID=252671 RepID=UPI0034D3F058